MFLAALKGDEPYSLACKDILECARAGSIVLITSYVALIETTRTSRNELRSQPPDEGAIVGMMDARYIQFAALEQIIAEKAREIVWDTPIRSYDAIHVATAIVRGCDTFYTTDGKLIAKSGLQTPRVRLPLMTYPEFLSTQTSLGIE